MIKEHQQKHPRIFSKYKEGAYIKGSFHGGSNIYHNLIKCDDKIVIPPIMQSYILHWYHYYLLHPGIDGTEAMIRQNLYWTGIRKSVQKEGINCDTFQCTKQSNKKYGKLPAKEAE